MDWNGLWRLLFFRSVDCFSRGKVNSNRTQLFKEGEALASCYEPDFLTAWASHGLISLGAWCPGLGILNHFCRHCVCSAGADRVGVHRVPGGESSHNRSASAPTVRSTNCCPEHSQLSPGLFKKNLQDFQSFCVEGAS